MLARRVQRWSLVEGGSLPGSTNAPITPPSNRIVKRGQRRRCASVAASSGMPTPAKTTCPSLSWRALRTASSSAAVWFERLGIVNTLPRACGREQLVHPDQRQKFVPRLWPVNEPFEIFLHAFDGILVHEPDVVLHVAEHRFVDAVALVRCASERQLDHGIDGEEWNLGLVGRAPDLVVGNDALRCQDHLVGGDGEIDVHELQTVDLRITV